MDRNQQLHLWYFVAAFMGLLLVQSWLSQASVTERIPYSTFLSHLEAGKVASVTVRAEEIEGRYRESNWLPAPSGPFVVFMRLY
jgi:cell division protease FtsH